MSVDKGGSILQDLTELGVAILVSVIESTEKVPKCTEGGMFIDDFD